MTIRLRFSTLLVFAGLLSACGGASDVGPDPQSAPPPAPPPPPPAPSAEIAPLPEPYTQANPGVPADAPLPPPAAAAQGAPPPPDPSSFVQTYPTGQWVYLSGQGWVWIPNDTTATDMDGVPYSYLYTPAYGWTWYVSPWGVGPYHYGVWARHPWHPIGRHGYWVARPHESVRLGAGGRGGARGGGRR
jgi:hypothetical protein